MLDEDNAKEMEAALREDEELDVPDGMTPEEWKSIQEEAQAEEEFISDREDTVKPLVFGKKDGETDQKDDEPETRSLDASDGVLGSGDLEVDRIGEPINNEEELRKESVKEDIDPISKTDAAADSVADAPVEDSGLAGDTVADEPVATDPLNDAAPEGESVADAEPAAEAAEAAPADIINDDPSVTQAPSADVPEATDTPTPIPGGMPTSPVTTDTPAAAPAAEPKKKKKTGLIVGIVVFLLLVVGGVVGGILFYNNHEAPAQQVKDAISNVLNAKTVGATKVGAIESGQLPYIGMSLTSENELLSDANISLGFSLKGTSTFYLKIGGLKSFKDAFKAGFESSASGGKIDSDKVFNMIIDPIDDKWIALDVEGDEAKATMSCISESLNGVLGESFRKKAADAFDKYPYVKYKEGTKVENRNGVNYYEVEIDKDLQKKFSAELENAEELKAFEKCTTSFGVGAGSTKTSAKLSSQTYLDDEDEDDDDDYVGVDYIEDSETNGLGGGEVKSVKFGISSWSHELQAVETIYEDKTGKKTTLNLTFKTIPESDLSSAKTAVEIVEQIKTSAIDVLSEYACTELKSQYGDDYDAYFKSDSECIEMMKKQYSENLNLDSMLGGLGGAVQTSMKKS